MYFKKVTELLENYSKISGMDIDLLDTRCHNLLPQKSKDNFCTYIHKTHKCLEKCIMSDKKHIQLAEKNRCLIKYTCPFGIYEAVVPVMKDEEPCAYIILGLALDNDSITDKDIVELCLRVMPDFDQKVLEDYISRIPHCSKETLDAYASMLPLMAEYIENNELLSDNASSIGTLIKKYIKMNISSKITLYDLSYNLHCSTVTLTQHFKKEFGMTINEYVTHKKMSLAMELIKENLYSVSEIAQRCGYDDSEYFSKCFKKYWKNTPSEVKKKL